MPNPAPQRGTPGRTSRPVPHRTDRAGAGSLQLLAIIVFLTIAIPIFADQMGPRAPTGESVIAEQRIYQGLDDLFTSTDTLCCPEDPSSPNHFHNLLMATIAGDQESKDLLEDVALPFFPGPDTTHLSLDLGFAPQGEPGATTMKGGLYTIPVLQTREPTGQTTGKPHLLTLPEFGPAHVIPRLENVSGEATIDIDYIPLEPTLPYRTTPTRLDRTTIQTTINHTRTAITSDLHLTLEQTNHAQAMGGWSPHMDLHWAEPDWLALEEGLSNSTAAEPRITYTLSSAELLAERTIHDELNPLEPLPEGIYPQHQFRLNVNLTGPGEVARAPVDLDTGDQYEVPHAYRLEIDIPRGWTNVEINNRDKQLNNQTHWDTENTFVFPQKDGTHRIIALLNATELSYRNNITTPQGNTTRYLLTSEQTLQAPFHFHAQPPDTASNTDLGFQHIQARLTNTQWTIEQRTTMTLELANNPGRVHRTITTTTPQLLPNTPQLPSPPPGQHEAMNNETHKTTTGIPITLAAVLENGAEPTTIKKITFTAPPDTFLHRDPDPTTPNAIPDARWTSWPTSLDDDEWTINAEGSQITWRPTTPPTCLSLQACGVAATVYADGRNLTASDHPHNPESIVLYQETDVDDFVHWFVRTNNAYQGVPLDTTPMPRPTFARATHDHQGATHGPHDGTYVIRLPPSTTPLCSPHKIHARNTVSHHDNETTETRHYNTGPREDGYPYTDIDPTCLQRTELATDHRFPLIITTGNNTPGGPAIRSIGKTTYATTPVNGDPGAELSTAWQNGLKEAKARAPETVEPGQTATFTIRMQALADELVRSGIEDATVRYRVYDPYNAWEERAWAAGTLVRQGAIWLPDPTKCVDPDCSKETSAWECLPNHCDPPPGMCPAPDGFQCDGAFPFFMSFGLEVPDRVVLGTHVLVVEVSWVIGDGGGDEGEGEGGRGGMYQTGRVVVPFDVVLPGGDPGRASLVGGVAWTEDWG